MRPIQRITTYLQNRPLSCAFCEQRFIASEGVQKHLCILFEVKCYLGSNDQKAYFCFKNILASLCLFFVYCLCSLQTILENKNYWLVSWIRTKLVIVNTEHWPLDHCSMQYVASFCLLLNEFGRKIWMHRSRGSELKLSDSETTTLPTVP